MTVYLDLVVLLNFLVDGLLLMGANRLTGYPAGWRRCALAAAVGGVYAGACMLPACRFLGNTLWRIVSLVSMAVIAFGWNFSALRRGTIFVLLSMALGGLASSMGNTSSVRGRGLKIPILISFVSWDTVWYTAWRVSSYTDFR